MSRVHIRRSRTALISPCGAWRMSKQGSRGVSLKLEPVTCDRCVHLAFMDRWRYLPAKAKMAIKKRLANCAGGCR